MRYHDIRYFADKKRSTYDRFGFEGLRNGGRQSDGFVFRDMSDIFRYSSLNQITDAILELQNLFQKLNISLLLFWLLLLVLKLNFMCAGRYSVRIPSRICSQAVSVVAVATVAVTVALDKLVPLNSMIPSECLVEVSFKVHENLQPVFYYSYSSLLIIIVVIRVEWHFYCVYTMKSNINN